MKKTGTLQRAMPSNTLTTCHCGSVGGRLPHSGAAAWMRMTATAAQARRESKYPIRVLVSGIAPPSHP